MMAQLLPYFWLFCLIGLGDFSLLFYGFSIEQPQVRHFSLILYHNQLFLPKQQNLSESPSTSLGPPQSRIKHNPDGLRDKQI
ncbi:hypothetical protein CsatB_023097 [Cannabis sativa]